MGLRLVVVDFEEAHAGVPDFAAAHRAAFTGLEADGGHFLDGDAVEVLVDGEHAADDVVALLIGAQFLLVEVIELVGQLIHVVTAIPGGHAVGLFAGPFGGKGEQLGVLLVEGGLDALHHAVDEGEGVVAALHHAAGGRQVGEGVKAQQLGELAAQLHHAGDDRCVVPAAGADGGVALPAGLARGFDVAGLHHGAVAGVVHGDEPLRVLGVAAPRGLGGLAGVLHPVLGHAGQLAAIGDEELPVLRRVQHIFAEAIRQLRELAEDFGAARFLIGGEVGAVVAEGVDDLLHVALLLRGERLDPGLLRGALDNAPEAFVGGDGAGVFGVDR